MSPILLTHAVTATFKKPILKSKCVYLQKKTVLEHYADAVNLSGNAVVQIYNDIVKRHEIFARPERESCYLQQTPIFEIFHGSCLCAKMLYYFKGG